MPIELREHIESDIEAYAEWQMDPDIAAFVSWLPRSRSQIEASLSDAITQQQANFRIRYFFAVVESASDEVVGDVGFTLIAEGVGDCGWFIRRKYWGKGYATLAVREMITLAFEKVGVRLLKASCARNHLASRRVMEKCGCTCVDQTETRFWYALPKSLPESRLQT